MFNVKYILITFFRVRWNSLPAVDDLFVSPRAQKSRFGQIPKPTVTVWMKEERDNDSLRYRVMFCVMPFG